MSILLILVALACGVCLVYEISHAIQSSQAKNWDICVGELIRGDIEPFVLMGSSFKNFRYKYVVSGREYESGKIGFGFPSSVIGVSSPGVFQPAEKILDEVLADAPRVTVYHSPDNPQNSVLCAGVQDYHVAKIIGLGFGLIVFLAIAIVQL